MPDDTLRDRAVAAVKAAIPEFTFHNTMMVMMVIMMIPMMMALGAFVDYNSQRPEATCTGNCDAVENISVSYGSSWSGIDVKYTVIVSDDYNGTIVVRAFDGEGELHQARDHNVEGTTVIGGRFGEVPNDGSIEVTVHPDN